MANPYYKDFDQVTSEMITDFKNQNPNVDLSTGSIALIKTIAFSAAVWGLYKGNDYTLRQIHATTADEENLRLAAADLAITLEQSDTIESIRQKVLDQIRNPNAGGNRYDVARWIKSASSLKTAISPEGLTITKSGNFQTFDGDLLKDKDVKTIALNTSGGSAGDFIEIDLGGVFEVGAVGIFADTPLAPQIFEILGFNTSNTWESVGSFNPQAKGYNSFLFTNDLECSKIRFQLAATHPATNIEFTQLDICLSSSTEEKATETAVFDNSPFAGSFEVVGYKRSEQNDILNLSSATLADIWTILDELKPVGTTDFKVLLAKNKDTTIDVSLTGSNVNLDAINKSIQGLVLNLGLGNALNPEQIAAICYQNGGLNVVINSPSAKVEPLYYEFVKATSINVAKV